MFDDDYCDGSDPVDRYKISDYTGESKFWNQTHRLSKLNSELFDRLVPSNGEAQTQHGETLRMINRVVYDIFNNGLCNDKRPEIDHLIASVSDWQDYLQDGNSANFLAVLRNSFSDYSDIEMNQANCDRLDDITQSVVQYVAHVEGALVQ